MACSAAADVKSKIERLNQTVQHAGEANTSVPCADCYPAPTSSTIGKVRACVESICPTNQTNMTAVARAALNAAAAPDPGYDREVKPLVDAAIREDLKTEITRAEARIKYLERSPVEPSPAALRTYKLLKAFNAVSKIEGYIGYGVNTIRSTDPDLKGDNYTLALVLRRKLQRAQAQGTTWDQQKLYDLRLYKTDEQIIAGVRDDIKNLIWTKERTLKSPDLQFLRPQVDAEFNVTKLSRPFASGRVDLQSLQELERSRRAFDFISGAMADPEISKLIDRSPYQPPSADERSRRAVEIRARIKAAKVTLARPITADSTKCRLAYASAKNMLTSRRDIAALMPKLKTLQAQSVEKTKDLICAPERDRYVAEASQWTPKVTDDLDTFSENLKRGLKGAAEAELTYQSEQARANAIPESNDLHFVGLATSDPALEPDPETADDVCEPLTPLYLPDAAGAGRNYNVGPAVLKDFERYQRVTRHELGHKADYFARQLTCAGQAERLRGITRCLLKNHHELPKATLDQELRQLEAGQKSRYRDEDLADLIEQKTSGARGSNFLCIMFGGTTDADFADASMQNFNSYDVHSSNFFRLLHVNFLQTHETPPVCGEALKALGQTADFTDCWPGGAPTADASH